MVWVGLSTMEKTSEQRQFSTKSKGGWPWGPVTFLLFQPNRWESTVVPCPQVQWVHKFQEVPVYTRVCMHTQTHKKYVIYIQLAAEIKTESSGFTVMNIPMNTSKIMSYRHGHCKQSHSLQLVRTEVLKYMYIPVSLVAGFGNWVYPGADTLVAGIQTSSPSIWLVHLGVY